MLVEQIECEDLMELGETVVDCARRVYRRLGPEHAREAYLDALCEELERREINFQRGLWVAEVLGGTPLNVGHIIDILACGGMAIKVIAVPDITPEDEACQRALLALTGHRLGYVLNFGANCFDRGVRHVCHEAPSASLET